MIASEAADPIYAPIVRRAVEALTGPNGARMVTEMLARTVIARAVHEARQRALTDSANDLRDANALAAALGISRQRVLVLARSRGLGAKIGRDYVFRQADLDAMRERRPGRPRRA